MINPVAMVFWPKQMFVLWVAIYLNGPVCERILAELVIVML